MTTMPEWTPAYIDQVRALVERLRHELAEHDDGVWLGIGSAIVTLVPSALDELSRLQAENARLRGHLLRLAAGESEDDLEEYARTLGPDEWVAIIEAGNTLGAQMLSAVSDTNGHLANENQQLTARLAELEAVVERLATRRPYAPNPYRDCFYCYGYGGDHEPDCLWLRARRLMGAGGGD